jgi:hypothetical protein
VLLAGTLLPPARAEAAGSATAARRADPTALAAARRFLCPHGGAPVRGRGGRCRGAPGPALAAAPGLDPPPGWWDGGIPPPTRRQLPCPAGTLAVPALARGDALRCLPQ